MPALLLLLAVLGLAACGQDTPAPGAQEPVVPPAARDTVSSVGWASTPGQGVTLTGGDTLLVETGPHVVLRPAGQAALQPPYTVRASMQKLHGRLHEGYGIVFGGEALDGPESGQRYSYFLVRGDGSYLIKRRAGAETPVVRPWTTHPAIRRDPAEGEGGRPNTLEVRVGEAEVAFLANGEEVARVPAAELDTRGIPGVRVAHDVRLALTGFEAAPGAGPADAPR